MAKTKIDKVDVKFANEVLQNFQKAHPMASAQIPDFEESFPISDREDLLTTELGSAGRPVFVVIVGSGKRGKSFLARYIVQALRAMGFDFKTFDFERFNPGVRAMCVDCIEPPYDIQTGPDMAEYLYPIIAEMAAAFKSMFVDTEGNDERFVQWAEQTDLLTLFEAYAMDLVIVVVTGGASDDTVLLNRLVDALGPGSYALNVIIAERLLPSHRRNNKLVEAEMFAHEGVAELMKNRRSNVIYMPTCDVIAKLDHCAVDLRSAAATFTGPTENSPLELFERGMLRRFLDVLDERFKGFFECLR